MATQKELDGYTFDMLKKNTVEALEKAQSMRMENLHEYNHNGEIVHTGMKRIIGNFSEGKTVEVLIRVRQPVKKFIQENATNGRKLP